MISCVSVLCWVLGCHSFTLEFWKFFIVHFTAVIRESEYTIFSAGLRVNQENAKLFNNVGHALEKVHKFTEALDYFEKAARLEA